MTRTITVENLLDQILALPDEAQVEIIETLIESRADDAGVNPADEEQRTAPTLGKS